MNGTMTLDATAQAELVRRGDISPLDLVTEAIDAAERCNPSLNAIVTDRFERCREEAKRFRPGKKPFSGVPILLKDIDAASAGDPLHAGMSFLKNLNWIEPEDSHVVTLLRRAGFLLLGRTNTPELAMGQATVNRAYGPTVNPHGTDRSPGGSSGGSGAAVAAGVVSIAHGTDSGGSVRIPASLCGVVGLKPSRGRVSLGPHGYAFGMTNTHGFLARSVRDCERALRCVSGVMPDDPWTAPALKSSKSRRRVGVLTSDPEQRVAVDDDCLAAVRRAASVLEGVGYEVTEVDPEDFRRTRRKTNAAYNSVGVAHMLDEWSRRTGSTITREDVQEQTWLTAEQGRGVSGPEYLAAVQARDVVRRRMARAFADIDVLVTPTVAIRTPPAGPIPFEQNMALAQFTAVFNHCGQPALSIPYGLFSDGMPLGVQLVSRWGREDILFETARDLGVT